MGPSLAPQTWCRQRPVITSVAGVTTFLARNDDGELLLSFGPAVEDRLDHDHDNPLAAAFVVVERSGAVLLVFDNWRRQWELPGGGREPGESARETAVRELFEESGLRAEKLIFVGVSSYEIPPDDRHERVAVFRTTLGAGDQDPVPVFEPNAEIAAVRWWHPDSGREDVDPLDAVIIDRVLADGT